MVTNQQQLTKEQKFDQFFGENGTNKPPQRFLLIPTGQITPDGWTQYEEMTVRFGFMSKAFGDPPVAKAKFILDGDPENRSGYRYWDASELPEGNTLMETVNDNNYSGKIAKVRLATKPSTQQGKWTNKILSIDFIPRLEDNSQPTPPVKTENVSTAVVDTSGEVIASGEERKVGSISPQDKVPAIWMLPREYHEQANQNQRISIERQVAVKGMVEFCTSENATAADRHAMREMLRMLWNSNHEELEEWLPTKKLKTKKDSDTTETEIAE